MTRDDWCKVIGSEPEVFCESLCALKPSWAVGSLSYSDARFLFRCALNTEAAVAVEIGTASGFSTAVLCCGMHFASQAGVVPSDFKLFSYDVSPYFYADRTKEVGQATRDILATELLEHVTFRVPASALNLPSDHLPGSLWLVFIDARHEHPWPTLDLLAALDVLAPGATVVLHDINLPMCAADFPHWGAKHLFDDVTVEKEADPENDLPNIGKIIIPDDKDRFRDELLGILFGHPWESDVSAEVTSLALR